MPRGLYKNFAKRTGKTTKEISEMWDNAKKIVAKQYPEIDNNSPQFYSLVVGVLKKSLGLKEDYKFLNKFKKLLTV